MAKDVKFNIKLSIDGKQNVTSATAEIREMREEMKNSLSATKRLSESFVMFNQSVTAVDSLRNAISSLTGEANTYAAAMAKANTMAGLQGKDFDNLKDSVSELAKTIPITREELANGLYQVISNGVPKDNWITFLQQSAKASVGGVADLGEAVQVTSTIIKNYGLDWKSAGDIQDKIQLTAKNGVTSFEQLAQALPRVTGNAATLGVSIDELMATFATLTGVSGNTAEVSTQLAAIFTALVKPSSEATKMAQQMGIEFDAAAIKAAGGMRNFLTELDKNVKGYASTSGMLEQEIYGKLFGSAESLRALIPLTGELSSKYNSNVEAMHESTGTITEAFNTMASTGTAKTQLLKNSWTDVTDSIAKVTRGISPFLNIGSQIGLSVVGVTALGKNLTNLSVSIRNSSIVTRLWSTITQSASAATTALGNSTTVAAGATTALSLSVQRLMCVTVVGAAISALTMVIYELISSSDSAADSAKNMADAETQAAQEVKQAYDSTLQQTYSQLMGDYEKLQQGWNSLKSTHEKNEWIKSNKPAFDNLRLSINSISDAEDIFNKNTGKVQEAFERRAQAAGYAAQMANLYGKQLQLQTRANDIKLSIQTARQFYYKQGNKENDPYFYQTVNQKARDFAIREDRRNGNDGNIDFVFSQLERVVAKINDTKRSIVQLGNTSDLIRPGEVKQSTPTRPSRPSSPSSPSHPSSPTPSKTEDSSDLSSLQSQITALSKEIANTKDAGLRAVLQSLLDMLLREKQERADLAAKAAAESSKPENANPTAGALISPDNLNGLKPVDTSLISASIKQQQDVEIDVKTKNMEALDEMRQKIESLNNIDITNFASITQALQSVKSISKPTAQGFAAAGASCEALGTALQQLGADSSAAKAGLVLAAVGQLALSFAQAMVSAAQAGWIAWLAFGIAGTAQLISLVATISGFTTGGVVAGSSERGDKLMVGVNSGEMILNKPQQRRLFDLANGRFALPGMSTPQNSIDYRALSVVSALAMQQVQTQPVEFRIKGDVLYGVLQNTRKTSGRRYRI